MSAIIVIRTWPLRHPASESWSLVVARVTDEGVDNTSDFHYESILSLVKSVTSQPVKHVLNTHHHGDHTGGNVQLLQHAQILAHRNARAAMMGANRCRVRRRSPTTEEPAQAASTTSWRASAELRVS